MAVTAGMVKELRDRTGAGMMDCKKALAETNGDLEKAVDFLRKKGLASAAKKAGRVASEGAVGSYIHMGGKIGVLVEINSETDFVARSEAFQELVKDLAMHIAAAAPEYVRPDEVPAEMVARERDVLLAQPDLQNKPENIREKIVEGRLEKFYSQICLLNQLFVKDDKKKVSEYVGEIAAQLGENIQVRRFARFVLGEGLEKREDNFAEEVARQMAGE
ncbi:MAG: translation elongation factor Ts [Myxococcales bacterium]|nr:translation elongation factor Ts [Myxococcales bacterium]